MIGYEAFESDGESVGTFSDAMEAEVAVLMNGSSGYVIRSDGSITEVEG